MWKNAALLIVSLVLSLLAADAGLGWLMREPAYWKARQLGIAYDARDRLDVIMAHRRNDPNWFPAVPANTYLEHAVALGEQRIIPLGGVANANVVGCNEAGYYSTFTTDEAGFNNPPGTWPLGQRPYIFLVGDSFTQGDCMPAGAGIADQLRKRHPEVVNLGVGGNGPLLELAAIREYIPAEVGSLVFWLYFEGNDLVDLQRDIAEPILARYLDVAYDQRLAGRQAEINAIVRSFVERRMDERLQGRAVILPALREALWRVRSGRSILPSANAADAKPLPDRLRAQLLEVVARAQADVRQRGGELVFVCLPEYARLVGAPVSQAARQTPAVLEGVKSLGMPVIDMEPMLKRQHRGDELFPMGIKAHYNEAGYRLVADELDRFVISHRKAPR